MERRKFTREFKLEAVRLIKDRGVSYVQASQDLNVHPSQLRDWVKKLSEDPQHAFPGHGQMKPEQLAVRLKREVAKLKAERDILKRRGLLREGIDVKVRKRRVDTSTESNSNAAWGTGNHPRDGIPFCPLTPLPEF
jgi:transposase